MCSVLTMLSFSAGDQDRDRDRDRDRDSMFRVRERHYSGSRRWLESALRDSSSDLADAKKMSPLWLSEEPEYWPDKASKDKFRSSRWSDISANAPEFFLIYEFWLVLQFYECCVMFYKKINYVCEYGLLVSLGTRDSDDNAGEALASSEFTLTTF